MSFIYDENLTISGYLESLYTKHLENQSNIVGISGSPAMDGYYSNVQGYTGNNLTASSASSARFYLDTYNNTNTFGSSFRGRRFRGSSDAPSGILKNDVLLQLVGDGSYGSGIQNAIASLVFFADEDFVSGRAGTFIRIRTTPTGSATALERILIKYDGNVGISNYNPQYTLDISGIGNFTEGLLINGANIGSGNFQVMSGTLSDRLTATGSHLLSLLGAGTVASVNTKVGLINVIGEGSISVSEDLILPNIIISGNTGEYINFYKTANPAGYITNSGFLLISQTGQFYPASNNQQYIKSGDVISTYATINTVNTLTTNLNLTGSNLYNYIIGLSGKLDLSGNNLQNSINIVSTNAQANGINLSGNLQGSGSTLDGRIILLSGYSNNNFYLKSNPSNYVSSGSFISGVSISGGPAIQGALNINAGSNIILSQQGSNSFSISSVGGVSVTNLVSGISVSGGSSLTGLFSIIQGTNITLTQLGNTGIMIGGAAGAGEANTASNLSNGSGLFSTKAGVDLQFKSLNFSNEFIVSGDSNKLNININESDILSGMLGQPQSYGMGFGKTTSDIRNALSATLMDVSGLSFYAKPNSIYGYEAFIPFQTNTATCGLSLAITGPTGIGVNSATGIWSSEIMTTPIVGTDAYQSVVRRDNPSISGVHTTASVVGINTPHIARIMGQWICDNNSGIVQIRFAPEINTNIATILRGAWIKYF